MSIPAVLIGPNAPVVNRIERQLSCSRELAIPRAVTHYPDPEELSRLLQLHEPAVVLLYCGNTLDQALRVAAIAELLEPAPPVIAIDPPVGTDAFLQLMRAGVREVLPLPLTGQNVDETLHRVVRLIEKSRSGYSDAGALYCFLPAKPGVGSSVVAVNAGIALSRVCEGRALLCDLDLNLGTAAFFLKLQASHCILHALECAGKLDESLWGHFVDTRDGLDITGPGAPAAGREPHGESLALVLRFARRMYGATVADLSGNMEPWTHELLRQATQIFLVCTHEIPALHMARIKADALRELQVQDRVSVLLNRTDGRQALSVSEIEKVVGLRVRTTFQNDYKGVNDATLAGCGVDEGSELGRQFAGFAATLAGRSTRVEAPAPRRRFLEFFSVAAGPLAVQRQR